MPRANPKQDLLVRSLIIMLPSAEVWSVIGDFAAPHRWLPGISSADTIELRSGMLQRRCDTVLGEFRESLLEIGPLWMIYQIDSGPIEVSNYRAMLALKGLDDRTTGFFWAASFRASREEQVSSEGTAYRSIEHIFDAGIARIRTIFPTSSDARPRWKEWGLPLDKLR